MIGQVLIEALGANCVDSNESTRRAFSRDRTESPASLPEVVVYAQSVEHVQAVLSIARAHNVPVVPVVENSNIGGLAIPEKGGIILQMKRMNRILEVNEADLYMVIEPGVSWLQVRQELETRYPRLRFGYNLGPPESSVLCNCLMDGLTNLSLRFGPTSEWINGLEVVLANGQIMRTGIGAVAANTWCTNSPLPNLTGLFINAQGTTGIVTKMAVQLWPNRKFRRRFFIPAHDIGLACAFLVRLAREELCDDLAAISWPLAKMIFGQAKPRYRDPDEPALFLLVDFSSNFADDLARKEELVRLILRSVEREAHTTSAFEDFLEVHRLVRLVPEFQKFVDLPTRMDFLLDHPGGGLSWIGSYGPVSGWAQGVERGSAVMEQHGFPPAIVLRPMRVAHFGVLRLLCTFDRDDPGQVQQVRTLNEALCESIMPLGFVPYKTPAWIVNKYTSQIDPGFRQTWRTIKNALDPQGILNPGKWLT